MMTLTMVALVLIAIGISTNNLILAGMSGNVFHLTRSPNSILILLFLFIIQNQMILIGNWFGGFTQNMLGDTKQWAAIGFMGATGVNMLQEMNFKNKCYQNFPFDKDSSIRLLFSTATYAFVFSCSLHWLNSEQRVINNLFVLSILLFLAAGVMLGKHNGYKLLKILNQIGVLLVISGAVFLIIQKLKQGI